MDPATWSEVKRIFLQAASLAPAQRADYIDRECSGRPDLRAHVRVLLASDSDADRVVAGIEASVSAALPRAPAPEPPPPPAAPLPGTIGGCRVLRLLGEGATGLVYLGEQSRPHRQVAIKVLRPGHASPASLRRLEREAEIMARMRHAGIAQVIESGVGPGGPYVMMEYIEGQPLTRYARTRALSVNDRLALFLRVCDAVQHAHGAGVIHRDLKPANILVNDVGVPKVLDFGIARAADIDAMSATLGASIGQLMGTLAYMSPEQALGDSSAADTRADVYALGGLLFELLAGRPPLDIGGRTLAEALRIIQHSVPPRLGAISRACRGDLETIAAKALEKEPARRYQSVSELSGDVRRHLDRLPILARPPGALYEAVRFTQRHRSLVASGAVVLACVAAFFGWVLVTRAREHDDYLLAKSLQGRWLADAMASLQTIPGTDDARDEMLKELREPLERFAERHPDDPDVLSNLAAWCEAYASLVADRADTDSAIENYQRAHDILASLRHKHPEKREPTWPLRQSISLVRLGDLRIGAGDVQAAIQAYLDALALDDDTVQQYPDDYTAHDQLAWSYDRLANTYLDIGRIDVGRAYSEKLDQLARKIMDNWAPNPKALYCNVAAHRTRTHLVLLAEGQAASLAERARAIDALRTLIALDPDNKGYQLNLSAQFVAQGGAALRAQDRPTARAYLDENDLLVRALLQRDPRNAEVHFAAREHYVLLSGLEEAEGHFPETLDAVRRAVDHAAIAAELRPGGTESRRDYARSLSWRAAAVADRASLPEARSAIETARSELARLAIEAPWDHVPLVELAILEGCATRIGLPGPETPAEILERALPLCTPKNPLAIAECYEVGRTLGTPSLLNRLRRVARTVPPRSVEYSPSHVRTRLDAMRSAPDTPD